MHTYLEVANLGEGEDLPIQREARLGVGEAVVAALSLKARIARLLPVPDAPEEGGKGFVQAAQHILQDLARDVLVAGIGGLDLGEFCRLRVYPKLLRRIW